MWDHRCSWSTSASCKGWRSATASSRAEKAAVTFCSKGNISRYEFDFVIF